MGVLATQHRGHFRFRPGFTPASQRSGHAGQTPAGTVNVWLIVAATRREIVTPAPWPMPFCAKPVQIARRRCIGARGIAALHLRPPATLMR